jgi:hypothetical protein
MKYTKPQITHFASASFVIMSGDKQPGMTDGIPFVSTNTAYSADE